MTRPGPWLDGRLMEAPEGLATAVQRATGIGQLGGESGVGGAFLRARAEALLAEAVTGTATREAAMTLLTADALITFACEWAAEHEPERLRD